MNTLTLNDLLPSGWEDFRFEAFEPCASYSAPMDLIMYLGEDEAYRADRIDQFLTILWHPHEDRVIGVKLKGIRFLFESIQAIVKDVVGKDVIADDKFIPLVSALNLALTMQASAAWSEELQKGRVKDFKDLERSYELARGLTQGIEFDPHNQRIERRA